jgi:Rrf2 family protein
MLSKKAKYGLLALFSLAGEYGNGPVLISDLAERESIPKKFLEAILLDLKKHGILHSVRGKSGGYLLGRPPGRIFIGEVVRILDGPLAPVPCVSVTAYRKCEECRDEKRCGVYLVMKPVRDAIADILDGTSLEDVLRMKRAKTRRK